MKKNLIIALTILFAGMAVSANAQSKKQDTNGHKPNASQKVQLIRKMQQMDPAKMIEMRTKYMCNELMLSEETAAKFAPLYKSYLDEMQKVMNIGRKSKEEIEALKNKGPREITDKEIDEQFKARFERTAKMNTLQETYYGKFRKILSAKQVSKIFRNHSHEGVFSSIVSGRQHSGVHSGTSHSKKPYFRKPSPSGQKKEVQKKA